MIVTIVLCLSQILLNICLAIEISDSGSGLAQVNFAKGLA